MALDSSQGPNEAHEHKDPILGPPVSGDSDLYDCLAQ